MARRKKNYGSASPVHRSAAASALKSLRSAERAVNHMLKLGPRYCPGALHALLAVQGAQTAYSVHRMALDYKLRKGYLATGKRLPRLEKRVMAACFR